MNTPTFAEIVRQARKRKNLSQVVLAEMVGMSQRWISDIERGVTVQPRLEALRRLADVLNLDVADLVLAAGLASSKEGARRLTESIPADPDESPLTPEESDYLKDAMFSGFRDLSPADLREVIRIIKEGRGDA
jgi:transcriptional regulator with XRE-family HTH domain